MSSLPTNFMLIGATGVGKSTLFKALLKQDGDVRKTQAMVFHDEKTIDTPGEYLDNPRLYTALISTMTTIDTIIYVHPGNALEHRIPPGLFSIYGTKVVGVISKTDLDDADVPGVRSLLSEYGISGDIFPVSNNNPDSINRLRDYLMERSKKH